MKLLGLLFTLSTLVLHVEGFSAHLSRPWEPPSPSLSHLLIGNKRKLASSTEQSASTADGDIETASSEEDPKQNEDDDGYENMSLQDEHAAVVHPRVFLATPSGATVTSSIQPSPSLPLPTVWNCWCPLLAMTRPSNFLGVIMFHLLGTHLAIQGSSKMESMTMLLSTPSMCIVLLSLLLTSATSMVVNDYYDSKSGVDSMKRNRPLITGRVPMAVAKQFLYYLYAALLLSLAVIPGVPARLAVVTGLMLTFWYTKHLKPITWLKNVVCASLIALSPLTSGSAAMAVINESTWHVFSVLPLWQLTGMLFSGFVGREIMMDINDVVDDRLFKVRTVPVKYGRSFASGVSLVATGLMAFLALVGKNSPRQLALAAFGSVWMLLRAWEVWRVRGENETVVNRAIEEGKMSVLLLLASFV